MRTDAPRSLLLPAAICACAILAACRSDAHKPTTTRLTADRFAAATQPAPVQAPAAEPPRPSTPPPAPTPTPPRPAQASAPVAPSAQPADSLPIRSFIGEPKLAANVAPAADPVVLESVIGQINGRPVFVSEILDPLDGKLRELARESRGNRPAFINAARPQILGELRRRIQDELILAEARDALTPEQQQGLFFFLGQVQKNIVSQQAGSRLQADEALREGTGRTLQQEARDKLEQALINEEINRRILSRVNIPWRLVRQEYERDPARFNPAGVAIFRIIRVPHADAQRVREAEAAIADKPFAEAAAMEFNEFLRDSGGLQRREFRGELSQASLFAPALNEAARSLTPGRTVGPIRWDDGLAWIHLESIDQPQPKSLYDAQMELEAELRDRKRKVEGEIYFQRLLDRGSFTEIGRMIAQVESVAAERYLSPRPQ